MRDNTTFSAFSCKHIMVQSGFSNYRRILEETMHYSLGSYNKAQEGREGSTEFALQALPQILLFLRPFTLHSTDKIQSRAYIFNTALAYNICSNSIAYVQIYKNTVTPYPTRKKKATDAYQEQKNIMTAERNNIPL